MNDKALVAIHCLVYNHEPYLRDCLEGFVMQQTNFPFVAIVHDDASTDGSAAVIREYEQKYPHIFKPIYEIENQWSKHDGALENIMKNAIDAFEAKYVAMCEGDDYWTDSLKLQKQVDFMEAHQEVGLCYTDYNRLEDESGRLIESLFEKQKTYRALSYDDFLLKPGYLAPMTWVYRRDLLDMLFSAKVYSDGTYAYMLECMHNSKVAYLPEVTATYRSHVGSASSPIGAHDLFNYSEGVFRTQIYYTQKYPCTEELKNKVLLRGYLDLLPLSVKINNLDFIREVKSFMMLNEIEIKTILDFLEQGEMCRRSYAYKIGKFITTPFSRIKTQIKKYVK